MTTKFVSTGFVSTEDVSKHFSVSTATIRIWVQKGYIPKSTYIKIRNTYRFCLEDIVKALTTEKNTSGEPKKEESAQTKEKNTSTEVEENLELFNLDDDI
tara:strand:- start:8838 stop:9137 length:300 start_codon:yes stop_codon:yes gene_type:complete